VPEKVFLSYATPDREFAQSLKPRLNKILAAETESVDHFDLESGFLLGTDWRRGVRLAIGEATTVVIVTSPESERSDWVNYEVGLADALDKNLVIVGRKGSGHSAFLDRVSRGVRFVEVD
jgi:hypothetical protein